MSTVWVNGKLQNHVSVNDRGFTYGDGLFETVRVTSSEPELLSAHISRLEKGLQRLKFPEKTLSNLLQDLEQVAFDGDQVLKIIVSRGEGVRGYGLPEPCNITRVIQLSNLADFSRQSEQGVALRTCQYQLALNPALAGMKHLNRLEQVMARSEWQDSEIADGVVTDLDGYVVECTMSNIFWVESNVVYTPVLNRCGVEGVMRNHLIGCLKAQGIVVEEGLYGLESLNRADEIFISNSLIQIWPVNKLDASFFELGPVTKRLQKLLQESLH